MDVLKLFAIPSWPVSVAAEVAGISVDDVQNWIRRDLIDVKDAGPGARRRFSVLDIYRIAVMAECVRKMAWAPSTAAEVADRSVELMVAGMKENMRFEELRLPITFKEGKPRFWDVQTVERLQAVETDEMRDKTISSVIENSHAIISIGPIFQRIWPQLTIYHADTAAPEVRPLFAEAAEFRKRFEELLSKSIGFARSRDLVSAFNSGDFRGYLDRYNLSSDKGNANLTDGDESDLSKKNGEKPEESNSD